MKFTNHISSIKTIKQDDPDFLIVDGFVLSPRAGFEVNEKCPAEYRQILRQCLDNGWIKPVAYMRDSEVAWERLMS